MTLKWRIIVLFFSVGILLIMAGYFLYIRTAPPAATAMSLAASQIQYTEFCLEASSNYRPIFECYELTDDNVGPHEPVFIRHHTGETHKTLTFVKGEHVRFRFTPSKPGHWEFSTGGSIDIHADRPPYAKGFVAAAGRNWIRTATSEAFVPQYLMYAKTDLAEGLREFVHEHGFTGFHITNLRDFLRNPGYFEDIVLKTYRAGGATHFWIWGDESRRLTPNSYGVELAELYREIAARLGPIPGWTVGYGFDLHEWASAEEIESFRALINSYTSYRHMVGGRGYKNQYRSISTELDYASWEWHRPSYSDYVEHIRHAGGKPAFSEDRFRIRTPSRYPEKDYEPTLTRRGLWNSAIAGGVANIWGHKTLGTDYSEPYPNKQSIRTYRTAIDRYFKRDMISRSDALEGGHCLEGQKAFFCFVENTDKIRWRSNSAVCDTVVAIDTMVEYHELQLQVVESAVGLPTRSDWALVVSKYFGAHC